MVPVVALEAFAGIHSLWASWISAGVSVLLVVSGFGVGCVAFGKPMIGGREASCERWVFSSRTGKVGPTMVLFVKRSLRVKR